jgi:hypothetical protein
MLIRAGIIKSEPPTNGAVGLVILPTLQRDVGVFIRVIGGGNEIRGAIELQTVPAADGTRGNNLTNGWQSRPCCIPLCSVRQVKQHLGLP